MDFLGFLSSREKKVSNQKLEANISKLCEELSTGIIQLSDKAKQLNELKDKYNKMQSEVQTTGESSPTKPVKEKSLFSNWFGSSEDDTPPPSPTTKPIPDNNLQTSEDTINPDMLSAASTASAASTEQAQSQPQAQAQPQSSLTDQPFKDVSQTDNPQTPPPDYNSISSSSIGSDAFSSSSSSDAMQQPVPVPAATPAAAAAASPSLDAALQNTMPPQAQAPAPEPAPAPIEEEQGKSAISIGGKNRKKSKRSKKTIRKSAKKLNKVTKKQKSNNTDSSDTKAKSQGLAQALLQSQGQS